MVVEIKIEEAGPSSGFNPGSGEKDETTDESGFEPLIYSPKKYVVVWICAIAAFLFAVTYSHYGADFTGISYMQFYGFICATAASFLFMVAGIAGCLVYPCSDTSWCFSVKLIVVMILELGLATAALVFLVVMPLPNHTEFKEFVLTGDLGVFNRGLQRIEEEMHCCGVDSYLDYDYNDTGIFPLPVGCCDITGRRLEETSCVLAMIVNGTQPPDFPWGCWAKINQTQDFETHAPKFYRLMNTLCYLTIVLLAFSILYFVLLWLYFCPAFSSYLEEKRETAVMQKLAPDTAEPAGGGDGTDKANVDGISRKTFGSESSYSESSYSTISAPAPTPGPSSAMTSTSPAKKYTKSRRNMMQSMPMPTVAADEVDPSGRRLSTGTATAGGSVDQIQPVRGTDRRPESPSPIKRSGSAN